MFGMRMAKEKSSNSINMHYLSDSLRKQVKHSLGEVSDLIFRLMLKASASQRKWRKGLDQACRDHWFKHVQACSRIGFQYLLAQFLWPFARSDMVAHDSFTCWAFKGRETRPWPTRQRIYLEFLPIRRKKLHF